METGKIIPPSELILHPDGSIYHLKIKPEHLADTIILVGDPNRVEIISSFFDSIEYKGNNREIYTHTGSYNNKRLTVMSTGMGTDNIDIVMNELDALVNIDLNSRKIKEKQKVLNIVRLGTSGAIQPEIPLNSFIISEYGLGLDGLLYFYNIQNEAIDNKLTFDFIEFSQWPKELPKPYAVKASKDLMEKLGEGMIKGITATAPGFYGPQGRSLRLELAYPDLINKLEEFRFDSLKISNFEMETSALYGLGKLLGHNTVTVCVAIANRKRHEYNQNYKEAINDLIKQLLARITA